MLLCSEKIKHEFIYVDTRTQIRVYIYYILHILNRALLVMSDGQN